MDIGYLSKEVWKLNFFNIGDTKLKVILSPEECVRYDIDTSKTEFSGKEIKSAMRDILSLAEEECGFAVESEKLLVQLYPMPSGECEIFVTKLTGLSSRDKRALRDVDGLTTMQKKRVVYRFASREDLIRAAKAVCHTGVECELYREGERYYISIDEEITDGISELEILIEFADRLHDVPVNVLSEYATLVLNVDTFEKIISEDL